jgi:acetylornithine deacetylase/succinyl-diaminopimelate desuccinylase-like protein
MRALTLGLVVTLAVSSAVAAQEDTSSDHARKTFEIFRTIVEVDNSKSTGKTPEVARYLADELVAAGFPAGDVEVVRLGELAALVARYRGDGSSGARPILFLAHMDVVEALAEDWERPPFELTRDDKYFYARGTTDNKFGVAHLTSTFIRLKKEGFVPTRDLFLVFSGDEESGMRTTRMLARRPDLAEAEFALNSDAGGGDLDANGNAVTYNIQAAEKTFVTWEITVRNPGGHSSRPREDNAIYELADALENIQAFRFPVRWSEMTRNYFRETGQKIGGDLGEAMRRFAEDPSDEGAAARLARESSYVGTTRTTCVATMLRAGHAQNALPQSATATINCRVFPGVPVDQVEAVLREVVANDAVEFARITEDPTESPISEPRDDVMAAVGKAVHARYAGVKLIPYMESGGTDGMHFRKAGIPTWGVSGIFMNPDEMYAHGLDERVPIEAFYGALDHWSIIIRELAGPGD